jgi:hypothetical protein
VIIGDYQSTSTEVINTIFDSNASPVGGAIQM